MINNRQNGRRRGRNGNGQRTGNPGNPGGGSRIDNRARGNANQLYEKYKSLARDAQMSGDRVNTEYYLQFADHYFRVLNENRSRFEDDNQRRIAPVNSFDDPYGDEDYADEGEPIRAGEQGASNGAEQARGDFAGSQRDRGQRESGPRAEMQGDGRPRDGRQGDGRQGENRQPESRYQENRQRPSDQRDTNQFGVGQREDAGADGARRRDVRADRGLIEQERDDRVAATVSPVANDPGEDAADGAEPTPVAPRRRGRPRRDATPAAAPVAANDVPVAIDADRLPPSLSLGNAPVADLPDGDAEEAPRPRRRRARAAGEASQAS